MADLLSVPVIDFSACSLEKCDIDWSAESVQDLAQTIDQISTEYGFFYVTNHGVPEEKIQEIQDAGTAFFELPVEEKKKSKRCQDLFVGWTAGTDREGGLWGSEPPPWRPSTDPDAPPDRKEAYNWVPYPRKPFYWPPVDNFHKSHVDFHGIMRELSMRFLKLFALALGQEADFFMPFHSFSEGSKNQSCLRNLIYPPIEVTSSSKTEEKRLNEHTDSCTFSMIFQDDVGGLEVVHPNGTGLDAKPLEGAIVVLVADLLQMWSAGRYKAAKHRVGNPSDEKRHRTRHSTAFFVTPDAESEAVIRCVDGSDTYSPVKAVDYFARLASTGLG